MFKKRSCCPNEYIVILLCSLPFLLHYPVYCNIFICEYASFICIHICKVICGYSVNTHALKFILHSVREVMDGRYSVEYGIMKMAFVESLMCDPRWNIITWAGFEKRKWQGGSPRVSGSRVQMKRWLWQSLKWY